MVLGLSAQELAEEMGVELPERQMMHRFKKMGGKHFKNFGGCGCGENGGGSFSNIQGGAVAIGGGFGEHGGGFFNGIQGGAVAIDGGEGGSFSNIQGGAVAIGDGLFGFGGN